MSWWDRFTHRPWNPVGVYVCCNVWVTGTLQAAPRCRVCGGPMRAC